jgi:hypothetical protein
MFADGLTPITEDLGFQREDGKIIYFHGLLPIFQHEEGDLKAFRMFTSQLISTGAVRQRDIVEAFRVPVGRSSGTRKCIGSRGWKGFIDSRVGARRVYSPQRCDNAPKHCWMKARVCRK